MRHLSATLTTIGLMACAAPRVKLDVPARGAEPATRLAAYAALKPEAIERLEVTWEYADEPDHVSTSTHGLHLADGTVVYRVDDLLPAVDADSTTAEAAALSIEAGALEAHVGLAGLSLFGLSAIGGVGLGIAWIVDDDPRSDLGPLQTTIVLGVAASLALGLIAGRYDTVEDREKTRAFRHFDAGLRARLDLCEAPGGLAPCPAPAEDTPTDVGDPAPVVTE